MRQSACATKVALAISSSPTPGRRAIAQQLHSPLKCVALLRLARASGSCERADAATSHY